MKAKEMRDKTVDELKHLLADCRESLFKIKVQSMTGQEEKSSQARNVRRNIARLLTALAEESKKEKGGEGQREAK